MEKFLSDDEIINIVKEYIDDINTDYQPTYYLPLWNGEFPLNQSYNQDFKPVSFNVFDNIAKLELVAVISGHDTAEFVPTYHNFTVNKYLSGVAANEKIKKNHLRICYCMYAF